MAGPIRVTGPLLEVLDVLLAAFPDRDEMHGWAIAKAARRSGPTIYGVIDRLEDAGWVTGRWEQENPQPGKPRRRLYVLTPTGATAAGNLLEARRAAPAARGKGWSSRVLPGPPPGSAIPEGAR